MPDDLGSFLAELVRRGWKESRKEEYSKSNWTVWVDTSSWVLLSTATTPAFDIHVPGDYERVWTLNLMEHLCRLEDERRRLRDALAQVERTGSAGEPARLTASEALKLCYHRWQKRPTEDFWRCPVCGKSAEKV